MYFAREGVKSGRLGILKILSERIQTVESYSFNGEINYKILTIQY